MTTANGGEPGTLVTFGETMLRLTPPGGNRLENTDTLDVHVGGAESNAAVAASRFGVDATWLSKVPDTPLGRRVVSALHGYGIGTEVVWSDHGRQGTYYVELAGDPRGTNVIYDRANSALTTAAVTEFDPTTIADADWFFTTGITPALSPTLQETTANLLKHATQSGTTTAFDLNYRAKLWSQTEAKQVLTSLFPGIDVLIVAARDARSVLDLEGDSRQLAHKLASTYDFETVVVTRGAEGAVGWHDSVVHEQEGFETETISPIGSGDAFTGAFIARRIHGKSMPEALADAAATAALKRTIPGDVALVTPTEVRQVATGDEETLSR